MRLPKFEYLKPKNISDACSLLKDHKGSARVFAGGTDFLVSLKQRISTPPYVIGLNSIEGLDYIVDNNNNGTRLLRIGALTTLTAVSSSDLIKKKFPILADSSCNVASEQIRNMGTIGGNICLDTRCWYYNQTKLWRDIRPPCFKTGGSVCYAVKSGKECHAANSSDTVPALIALGAKVKIVNANGDKMVTLEEFYTGKGEPVNILNDDEVIEEIVIPESPESSKESFIKLTIREGLEFPIVNSAVLLTMDDSGKKCMDASVLVGGVLSYPFRAKKTEETLKGNKINENLIEEASKIATEGMGPIAHILHAPGYKRQMVQVCVKRALRKTIRTC